MTAPAFDARKDRREFGMLCLNLVVLALLCGTGLIFFWFFLGGWNAAKARAAETDGLFFFWFW